MNMAPAGKTAGAFLLFLWNLLNPEEIVRASCR